MNEGCLIIVCPTQGTKCFGDHLSMGTFCRLLPGQLSGIVFSIYLLGQRFHQGAVPEEQNPDSQRKEESRNCLVFFDKNQVI